MKKFAILLMVAQLSSAASFAETGTHGPITQGLSIPKTWPGEVPLEAEEKLKQVSEKCLSDLGVDLMDIAFKGNASIGNITSKSDDINFKFANETDRIMSNVVITTKDNCKLSVLSHACDGPGICDQHNDEIKLWSPFLVRDLQNCKQFPKADRVTKLLSVTGPSYDIDPLPTVSWSKITKYRYDDLGSIIGEDHFIGKIKLDEVSFGQGTVSSNLEFYNYNYGYGQGAKLIFSYPKDKYHQCMTKGISDVIGSNPQ